MSKSKAAAVVFAVLCVVVSTDAEATEHGWSFFVSSLDLYNRCSSNAPVDQSWCDGYVAGVIDAYGGSDKPAEDAAHLTGCFAKQLRLSQVKRVTLDSLKEINADSGEALAHFPGSRFIIAGTSVQLCEDSDARWKSIHDELGPQPPSGTPEFKEYVGTEGCMFITGNSLSECRDMARAALSAQ
jgi:hypothetical protein